MVCALAITYRSGFKFGIMFSIVKLIRVLCDQSSIFSAHQIPIWQLRICSLHAYGIDVNFAYILVLTINTSVAKFSFVTHFHMVLTRIT